MKKNKNDHVKESFLEWHEGQLDSQREQVIDEHLEMCESCSTYYYAMQTVFEEPETSALPSLKKDPFLPTRIRSMAQREDHTKEFSLLGLSKSLTASLVLFGLLFGFLIGQQLVYIADSYQTSSEEISVTELFYEGMVQPNIGTQLEQSLNEIEGDQQ